MIVIRLVCRFRQSVPNGEFSQSSLSRHCDKSTSFSRAVRSGAKKTLTLSLSVMFAELPDEFFPLETVRSVLSSSFQPAIRIDRTHRFEQIGPPRSVQAARVQMSFAAHLLPCLVREQQAQKGSSSQGRWGSVKADSPTCPITFFAICSATSLRYVKSFRSSKPVFRDHASAFQYSRVLV